MYNTKESCFALESAIIHATCTTCTTKCSIQSIYRAYVLYPDVEAEHPQVYVNFWRSFCKCNKTVADTVRMLWLCLTYKVYLILIQFQYQLELSIKLNFLSCPQEDPFMRFHCMYIVYVKV